MSVAVTLRAQTEREACKNEDDDSLFHRSEKESLSGLSEFRTPAFFNHEWTRIDTNFENDEILMTNDESMTKPEVVGRLCQTPWFFVIVHHCPSGVVTSVPGGGLNSNDDGETGARVWFE
jgi:hypothetical protein